MVLTTSQHLPGPDDTNGKQKKRQGSALMELAVQGGSPQSHTCKCAITKCATTWMYYTENAIWSGSQGGCPRGWDKLCRVRRPESCRGGGQTHARDNGTASRQEKRQKVSVHSGEQWVRPWRLRRNVVLYPKSNGKPWRLRGEELARGGARGEEPLCWGQSPWGKAGTPGRKLLRCPGWEEAHGGYGELSAQVSRRLKRCAGRRCEREIHRTHAKC